jgi:hypothetical protein
MLTLSLWLAPTGCGTGDKTPAAGFGPGHAFTRLIAETTMLSPGATCTLGVAFDIEPGWHLFWNGTNDTGYPISVSLDLPPGYSAGELQWPAPRRHVSEGKILDHIYSDRVTLLLPVQVPDDAKPGEWATIKGHVEWLACRDVCVPGESRTALTLQILRADTDLSRAMSTRVPSEAAERFQKTRSRLPVHTEPGVAGFLWRWADGALIVAANAQDHLAFYPGPNSAPLDGLIEDGESSSGSLTLRLSKFLGEARAVTGVLEIKTDGAGVPRFYTLEVPLPGRG